MARERTADDQVLALLARHPLPLPAAEIANELGWERSMISKILRRLSGQLDVTEDRSGHGRPTLKYTIRQPETGRAGMPPPAPRFEADTIVVTPSGREARVVLHRRDGYVEIGYLDGPRSESLACLKADLLRAFQPGRERPIPVVKG